MDLRFVNVKTAVSRHSNIDFLSGFRSPYEELPFFDLMCKKKGVSQWLKMYFR